MKFLTDQFHHSSFRTLIFISLLAVVSFGLASTKNAFADDPSASNTQRLVTIHDGDAEMTVVTRAVTVGDALKSADVSVGDYDIVEPSVKEQLVAKSYQVNVFRARPVVVVDGARQVRVMTAEQSPRQIAKIAGTTLLDEDKTTFQRVDSVLTGGGAGVQMIIDRATMFNFSLYGKRFESHTQARTVADVLKEKNITLGPEDGVSPDMAAAVTSGMEIRVWRNGRQTVTNEEVVVKQVEEVKDYDHAFGWREIRAQGSDGKRQVTYEIEIRGGVEVSRKEIASVTTQAPIKQVIAVGAKAMGAYTSPSENENITWAFLIGKGLTREQTAGIMGNLQQEHGFNTTGDGLAQWTGGRKDRLMALNDPYNINTQLNFMWSELAGPYVSVLSKIQAASSVDSATRIFQNEFERCGVCMEGQRLQYAHNILASH